MSIPFFEKKFGWAADPPPCLDNVQSLVVFFFWWLPLGSYKTETETGGSLHLSFVASTWFYQNTFSIGWMGMGGGGWVVLKKSRSKLTTAKVTFEVVAGIKSLKTGGNDLLSSQSDQACWKPLTTNFVWMIFQQDLQQHFLQQAFRVTVLNSFLGTHASCVFTYHLMALFSRLIMIRTSRTEQGHTRVPSISSHFDLRKIPNKSAKEIFAQSFCFQKLDLS